jgi:hypothetical protein
LAIARYLTGVRISHKATEEHKESITPVIVHSSCSFVVFDTAGVISSHKATKEHKENITPVIVHSSCLPGLPVKFYRKAGRQEE